MAKNFVEHHIQGGATFTFKVEVGQTVKIGDVVEITANGKVQTAQADSQKVLGVVYSGTVGVDGLNVGYQGDLNQVATVVMLKPLVYLKAEGAITAGDKLKAGATGGVVAHTSSATFVAGEYNQVVGMALQSASIGQRFLVALG